MEGIQKIASLVYTRVWSPAERMEADEFFNKLDANRDGFVSFLELRNSGIMLDNSFYRFNHFDVDGNGILDADEIRILYFLKYKADHILKAHEPGLRLCDGCRCRQPLPDYSCFFCLKMYPNTYDLCCSCYDGGEYSKHEHYNLGILNCKSLALLTELKYLLNEPETEQELKELKEYLYFAVQNLGLEVQKAEYVSTKRNYVSPKRHYALALRH